MVLIGTVWIIFVSLQSQNDENQINMNSCQEHEFVDLGLPSGTLWATCNVGANKPEDYGDYFAWGETQPKTQYCWSSYKYSKEKKSFFAYLFANSHLLTKYCNKSRYGYDHFTDNMTTLQRDDDAATANWGDCWCMPTKDQWQELINKTTNFWTFQNGVRGRQFIADNGNRLFLPAAGARWESSLNNAGSLCVYWSNSIGSGRLNYAFFYFYHFFSPKVFGMTDHDRCSGCSVRAVRSSE